MGVDEAACVIHMGVFRGQNESVPRYTLERVSEQGLALAIVGSGVNKIDATIKSAAEEHARITRRCSFGLAQFAGIAGP